MPKHMTGAYGSAAIPAAAEALCKGNGVKWAGAAVKADLVETKDMLKQQGCQLDASMAHRDYDGEGKGCGTTCIRRPWSDVKSCGQ
eukprot:5426824-Amphidinium_carterae.1